MDFTIKPINILIHLSIYLGVLIILKYLYVDPVLRLLRKRDALTFGKQQGGKEMQQKLISMKGEYDSRMSSVKAELDAQRSSALKQQQKAADERIAKVHRDLDLKISANHAQAVKNLEDLRKRIPTLGEELGREMAASITNLERAAR